MAKSKKGHNYAILAPKEKKNKQVRLFFSVHAMYKISSS